MMTKNSSPQSYQRQTLHTGNVVVVVHATVQLFNQTFKHTQKTAHSPTRERHSIQEM
jgi:hypothetical protein